MLAFFNIQERQFDPIDITGWTYAAIGDSITQGVGTTNNSARYTDLLAAEKSITMTNLGDSGNTLTTNEWRTGLKTKLGSAYGKQLITILAGTNDWFFNIPLGNKNDINDSEIMPAVNYFIQQIRLNSPDSEILFLLPLYRSKDQLGTEIEPNDPINELGLTILDYSNAIKKACILNQVRYLELYNVTGLEKTSIQTWSDDGLHPNNSGHVSIFNYLNSYFN